VREQMQSGDCDGAVCTRALGVRFWSGSAAPITLVPGAHS